MTASINVDFLSADGDLRLTVSGPPAQVREAIARMLGTPAKDAPAQLTERSMPLGEHLEILRARLGLAVDARDDEWRSALASKGGQCGVDVFPKTPKDVGIFIDDMIQAIRLSQDGVWRFALHAEAAEEGIHLIPSSLMFHEEKSPLAFARSLIAGALAQGASPKGGGR